MIESKQIQRPQRILVVDDQEINRDVLGMMLEDGYEVVYAENGKEALAQIRAFDNDISLVMLDLMMPVMNGFEVLEAMHNDEQMKRAMKMAHIMHESGAQLEGLFDIHEDTLKQIELLTPEFRAKYDDFDELFALACDFDRLVKEDGLPPVFCHNDFYDPNFLIYGDEMHLIDWEYAGMSDYASDMAVLICCSDFTYEEALHALELYFDRPLTDEELFHNVAYICVVSFHWLVWALYRAQCGEPVGPLETTYHTYARSYGEHAQEIRERLGR